MSAAALIALHRRVRRLLPAGLETVAVLPPRDPGCWATSPLSRLPLGGGRRGMVGLRLSEACAARLPEAAKATRRDAQAPRYLGWQALPGRGGLWCRSEGGALAVLVDPGRALAWLFWQEQVAGSAS
ncbi:hypothetical protein ARC20_00065 [Stenotrophomonas panacihumi]|uniref:Uncharacterized protein n=1 Tax=Stenotrophomonas panacihumi TaxID=676599 RepID=A0A0R0B5Z2_9GAMM|nr:hypothetical protein [Stenotrophomonas panacihumi]KRG49278.1 hypothetical protein ARC20_00065 [Stenotrophomonas panacihumi]PTN53955.1 hypothetical protein C9J98_13215 [Stenotrophomonas panacihumi]